MIDFNSNGIAIPESWEDAYAYVSHFRKEMYQERFGPANGDPEKIREILNRPKDRTRDPRDMYILERGEHETSWHHAGHNEETPSDRYRPICVIQEGSHAASYMHGFTDAMEAIEMVLWNREKKVDAEDVEKMVRYLVEMGRI